MQHWRVEKKGEITFLTLAREEVLNALNRGALEELQLFMAHAPKREVRLLVLSGEGRAFSAGADVKEMHAMSREELLAFCTLGQGVMNALEEAPFLTIALLHGMALGGGLELALACDYILATPEVEIGFPETKLGLIPVFGGTQRLTHLLGASLAKSMILSGRRLKAEEARSLGLFHQIVEKESLKEAVEKLGLELLESPLQALVSAKRAIHASHSLQRGLEKEKEEFIHCFYTPEAVEKRRRWT